ncbi:hypothetical protein [Nostoc sp. 'Peltigera membranacea cyanobiont' 213]|nr:hypothetical protein [Nostoc sp. 'Peltigera membranacea cyanobiont' 213]
MFPDFRAIAETSGAIALNPTSRQRIYSLAIHLSGLKPLFSLLKKT